MLYIRPHHGLCIAHYIGYGYDNKFVRNMNLVTAQLTNDPKQEICLRITADVLCSCCPNNRSGVCETQKKVEQYDAKCLELCGLTDHQLIRWQDFQKIISNRLLQTGAWQQVCKECCWLTVCGEQYPDYTE